jgi:thiol-disulfide isomerase/thioredoxin
VLLPTRAHAAGNDQAEAWKSIQLVRHDGTSFSLNAVPGRVVVAALWGSFCSTCRAEVPALLRLQQEVGEDRLGVVLLSHPLFWNEDYPAAERMGLATKAATAAPDTDYDVLATAFGMRGTSLEVPQSLVYARSGSNLSPVYRKTGGVNWQGGEVARFLRS